MSNQTPTQWLEAQYDEIHYHESRSRDLSKQVWEHHAKAVDEDLAPEFRNAHRLAAYRKKEAQDEHWRLAFRKQQQYTKTIHSLGDENV